MRSIANVRRMSIRKHPDAIAFKTAADRYCALFEREPGPCWAETVLAALAEVYATAHRLPDFGLTEDAPDLPNTLDITHEEWLSLHAFAARVLGPQAHYRAYFDPSEVSDTEERPIFHSLADDLADIYRDIKPGLRAWDTGSDIYLETIVFDWKNPNFGSHWGVHAVSAMRALHAIVFR